MCGLGRQILILTFPGSSPGTPSISSKKACHEQAFLLLMTVLVRTRWYVYSHNAEQLSLSSQSQNSERTNGGSPMKTLIMTLASMALCGSAMAASQNSTSSHASCSAKEVQQYYCPTYSGWYYGPFFDEGCSVKCSDGQVASCKEASCDTNQNGESVASDCHCE